MVSTYVFTQDPSCNDMHRTKRDRRRSELTFLNQSSPFVQRVWISMEAKGLSYQYIEVDPYKKPDSLLEVNPRGLVPALRHGDWGCYESTVLMEYVRLNLYNSNH